MIQSEENIITALKQIKVQLSCQEFKLDTTLNWKVIIYQKS